MSARTYVAEQFESEAQQREAAQLGLWVFLGTEVMLLSGIFAAILIYRLTYWQALQTATHHLHVGLSSANTAVLLTSSLTMGFAVLAAREEDGSRRTFWYLIATALLGVAFLVIKGYEYLKEYREGLMPGVGPPFPLDVPRAAGKTDDDRGPRHVLGLGRSGLGISLFVALFAMRWRR